MYSVYFHLDPQLMVDVMLYPYMCSVYFHLDPQFIGGPVLHQLLCLFPPTPRPAVHDRPYMNLTT